MLNCKKLVAGAYHRDTVAEGIVVDFSIRQLGEPRYQSPLVLNEGQKFADDKRRLLLDPHVSDGMTQTTQSLEVAGPRANIFFKPEDTKAVIVTCGGLCPGLNAVVRAITLQLWYRYRVRDIHGIKFGYQGFADPSNLMALNPEMVEVIHEQGGTMLGTSRGTPGVDVIVRRLRDLGANLLFVIGGDGTMRGARAIHEETQRQGFPLAIVGVPKTIDNDIPFVKQSFGFESAVEIAAQVISAAHAEAKAAERGIGLVKLMGRHSGYIAANATLATGLVNFCLIPEQRFELEGSQGLFAQLDKRLAHGGHAVIVVAEGAGQHFFDGQEGRKDKSGNSKLHDIGTYLQSRINQHFLQSPYDVTLKYIDPSYIIRATKANSADRLFCAKLARNAVHAAMAGKTDMLVGYWHGRVTHIPLHALEERRQTIDPNGELWFNVLESTGQPFTIGSI